MEDCFVTDDDGNFLNVDDTNIEVIIEQTEDKDKTATARKFKDFEI